MDTGIKTDWTYLAGQAAFLKYKESTPFAHLHLDIIDGNYIYYQRSRLMKQEIQFVTVTDQLLTSSMIKTNI